jgi:hypothetical protein
MKKKRSPANSDFAANVVVSQSIPSCDRHVEMVLIAALTGVLNGDSDFLALPTNAVVGRGARISGDNFTAAIWAG